VHLLQLVIVIPGAARNLLRLCWGRLSVSQPCHGERCSRAFETDFFSNVYKIFLFLRRPLNSREVTIPLFDTSRKEQTPTSKSFSLIS